jgi:cyclic pyranopterin phosphate synthase
VLRPCLASDAGVSVGASAEPQLVAELVERAWSLKPDGRVFKGCTEPEARLLSMRAIGG